MRKHELRCLWLTAEMPHPLENSERIYAASLTHALAQTGLVMTVVGREGSGAVRPNPYQRISYVGVDGDVLTERRASLGSSLPAIAAINETSQYRGALSQVLTRDFDVVVIDGPKLGWTLPTLLEWRADRLRRGANEVVLVYVTPGVTANMVAGRRASDRTSFLRRKTKGRDFERLVRLEAELVQGCDLVVAQTLHDAEKCMAIGTQLKPLILNPGYSGAKVTERRIETSTSRNAILLGSFTSKEKARVLQDFVAVADPVFADAGIHFDVIGRVDEAVRAALTPNLRATTLHGYTQNVDPFLARARVGIIPHQDSSGYRFKMLDYMFHRVPVMAMHDAVVGVDPDLQSAILVASDVDDLVARTVSIIDTPVELNRMQNQAFELLDGGFDWSERGLRFRTAIEATLNSASGRRVSGSG